MIRLLIISNYCSQSKEGKPSVTARLEKVLALYCNSELKTAIAYNSKDQKDPFNKDGIDYYPISSDMFLGDIFKKWDDAKEELKTVIVQFKPDIIYCFGTEMPYSAISQETDLPVVVHVLGNLNIYTMMLDSVRHFSAENDINQDLTYVNQEAIKTTEKNNRKSKRIETFTNAFELEVLFGIMHHRQNIILSMNQCSRSFMRRREPGNTKSGKRSDCYAYLPLIIEKETKSFCVQLYC